MSRIHEALQRAAEQAATSDDNAIPMTALEPAADTEIAALSREAFPVEIGAHRLRPPASDHGEATSAKDDREKKEKDEKDEQDRSKESEPRTQTLFERIDGRLAEKVVVDANMSPVSREQYRRLAAMLHDAQGDSGLRVVMVASAVPGEGKTLTATNVALTLSDSYRRRVLLIDADLRKPTLHQVFRLTTTTGLVDGLDGGAQTKLVLRQVSPTLSVLPAGRPTADPMAALTSDRMRQLIDEAKETFDWVIIDTPPLMLLPDAHLLTSLVDGAVLVIKANSTPHEMVKRTVEIVGQNRVVGVVLNQAITSARTHGGYYGYGHYYLAPAEESTANDTRARG